MSMINVYERNNIYVPGTNTLDPDKMVSRTPVLIFTGNVHEIENTKDKNHQIPVDIEYVNMQNPELNFTMINAALRPQGTSSMAYPKKNFRIYTQKYSETKVYDFEGKEIIDKLYSFNVKEGNRKKAQPVNCWCLKADYAESSGTHNTGVSRIWNDVIYNASIEESMKPAELPEIPDRFVFRTEAQREALLNNYPYDVRTTVDGFPILVFYRVAEGEDLIFIGKYNFNNDKSTEAVFGFKDIPGFDDSNMQCWEILNNGHHLTLFTDVSDFDSQWDKAWESRYPDTSSPTNTLANLKAFSIWMHGIDGDHARFATEKWERFNVYNAAAYYVYLLRFGAVDQPVKNAFLTSEDGVHYYFINYDNDTIFGVANTGNLEIPPTADRQSKDSSGNHHYAGYNSVMWNMFEADSQFMEVIVPLVDYALTTAGLTYNKVIELFNDKQAEHWVERVYNQDARYKYIDLFTSTGENNLFMLHGKRDLHREWWAAKRFALLDARWVSGDYRSKAINLKCQVGTPINMKFSIISGESLDYGYGVNGIPNESGRV